MPYEWDEDKRRENLLKHELDFGEIEFFQWNTASESPSPRYGEMRWLAIGYIGSRLHVVVYAERGDNIRIISLRKANAREERRYARTHRTDSNAN